MGAFNTVSAPATCPNCDRTPTVEVQFKYGDTYQNHYALGDSLRWGGNDIGDPNYAHIVADACAGPCPYCGYNGDWDLYVFVDNNQLSRVTPATGRFDFVNVEETYIVLDE